MVESTVREKLPQRFRSAYMSVENLQSQPRYLGAFIFGSLARGEATAESDFDVKVVTDEDSSCININHPMINGVKLDITFQSLAQLAALIDQQLNQAVRMPMIAESIIVFDKTGGLMVLKERAQDAQPKKAAPKDYQLIQFIAYHVDNKVLRQINVDQAGALISMGMGLNELVKLHYQIHGRWGVSDKWLLSDLESWDVAFPPLLRDFALAGNVDTKFALWEKIIDYILVPIGGRQPIAENNCQCKQCLVDLANLG